MALAVREGGGFSGCRSQLGLKTPNEPSLAPCTSFAGLSQEKFVQFLGALQKYV